MARHYEIEILIGKVPCQLINIAISETQTNQPGRYFDHYHPCFEMHYLKDGECHILVGDTVEKLYTGDILIIPPRTYHKQIYTSQNSKKTNLSICINKPLENKERDNLIFYNCFNRNKNTLLSVKNTLTEQILLQLERLSTENFNFINYEKTKAYFHNFLLELFSLISQNATNFNNKTREPLFSAEYSIDTFFALYFNCNSGKGSLAKELNVSQRQLSRIIKNKYGKNSILKGMNLEEGATAKDRNAQIGGHKA